MCLKKMSGQGSEEDVAVQKTTHSVHNHFMVGGSKDNRATERSV